MALWNYWISHFTKKICFMMMFFRETRVRQTSSWKILAAELCFIMKTMKAISRTWNSDLHLPLQDHLVINQQILLLTPEILKFLEVSFLFPVHREYSNSTSAFKWMGGIQLSQYSFVGLEVSRCRCVYDVKGQYIIGHSKVE